MPKSKPKTKKEEEKERERQAKAFRSWIDRQIIPRGMNMRQLAEKAGLNQGSLSNIFSGSRVPSINTCIKIARALNMPVESVLRAAGHIPPESTKQKQTYRIVRDILAQLSEENRDDVIKYAQFRLHYQLIENKETEEK